MRNKAKVAYRRNTHRLEECIIKLLFYIYAVFIFGSSFLCLQVSLPFLVVFFVVVLYLSLVAL